MEYISKLVAKIVKKFGTRNPFEICKCLGIKVLYHDLGPELKAYYVCRKRCHRIVLNQSVSKRQMLILVAHELGHHYLHKDLAMLSDFQEFELFDMVAPTEYEANLFASEMLLDDGDVLELLNEDISFTAVSRTLEVPLEILDFKFRLLKRKGNRIGPQYIARGDFLKKLPLDREDEEIY